MRKNINSKNKNPQKRGRGVRISAKIKAKALIMLMEGHALTYIHNELGIAISTISTWKKQFEDNDEFEKVRNNILKEQWEKFLLEAIECQEMALQIVGIKLKNALTAEKNRKELIEGIVNLSEGASGEALKRNMQMILPETMNDIARVFGLMTEKVAIMSGKASHNLNLNLSGEVDMKFEDFK